MEYPNNIIYFEINVNCGLSVEGSDTITEIERNCMRCQKSVSIDFHESVSQSGNPLLIGECPECNGVNIQRLPSKIPEKESSEIENSDNDLESSDIVSELSTGNPDNDLESPDNPSEEPENNPSEVEPSDTSEQISDMVQAYDQGYEDCRGDLSSDIIEGSENEDQATSSLEGESDQTVESDQDNAEESEGEHDNDKKGSGPFTPIAVLVIVMIIAIAISLSLAHFEG